VQPTKRTAVPVVVGCWRGYLSAVRCRLAYGPADATHCLLLQTKIQIGFTFLVPAHPGSPVPENGPLNVCLNAQPILDELENCTVPSAACTRLSSVEDGSMREEIVPPPNKATKISPQHELLDLPLDLAHPNLDLGSMHAQGLPWTISSASRFTMRARTNRPIDMKKTVAR